MLFPLVVIGCFGTKKPTFSIRPKVRKDTTTNDTQISSCASAKEMQAQKCKGVLLRAAWSKTWERDGAMTSFLRVIGSPAISIKRPGAFRHWIAPSLPRNQMV